MRTASVRAASSWARDRSRIRSLVVTAPPHPQDCHSGRRSPPRFSGLERHRLEPRHAQRIGGWVAKRSPSSPAFAETDPAQRVGDAEVGDPSLDRRVGAPAFSILSSAEARDDRVPGELGRHGVGQILPLPADPEGQQPGDRGASSQLTQPDHQQNDEQGARPLAPLAATPRPSRPARAAGRACSTRRLPSAIRAIAPASPATMVMSCMSRFLTCPISCAMTPWSSSRSSISSRPEVTARWLFMMSVPVTKAFGSGSSTI